MPVTQEQVERALNVDEPDYTTAARLGPAALPHLQVMARKAEPGLAAKAVHLASMISGEGATAVVAVAAERADAVVRVVAAAALARLPQHGLADIATRLIADREDSVRRRAITALPRRADTILADRLSNLANTLPPGGHKDDVVRALKKTR